VLDWQSLLSALALVLVLEGLLPFLNPSGYKSLLENIRNMPESQLRNLGLVLISAGLVLLYFVR
jgi:hypothetical protein